ncbi:unnamed protein product [Brassica oleracea]
MKFQVLEEYGHMNPPRCMCGGCNSEIEHGRSVDVLWHPECLWLTVFFQMKKFHQHPFWEERYCPAYESDGTPKCSSCERLEPMGTNYVKLSDALNKAEVEEKIDYQYEVITRGICLSEAQTIITSVSKRPRMGPHNQLIDMVTDSQRVVRDCEVTAILILYGLPRLMTGYILAHEMMHAYLRLNRYRNLNTVIEEGICQIETDDSPVYGVGFRKVNKMVSNSSLKETLEIIHPGLTLSNHYQVPLFILFFLLWCVCFLLVGLCCFVIYLAHEMMHAYLRLNSSSSHTPAATASKTGACSDFEKKLVDFCKNQIETDDSPVYVLQEIVQACVMKMKLNRSSSFVMCVSLLKSRPQRRERERFSWCVLLLGVEGDSEAFLWCHWCTLGAHVLGEVLPRSGRLKPRLRGSLAKAVSLKRSVKIAAVEDTVLRLTGW